MFFCQIGRICDILTLHNSNIQQESKKEQDDFSYLKDSFWNEDCKISIKKIQNVNLIFNLLSLF